MCGGILGIIGAEKWHTVCFVRFMGILRNSEITSGLFILLLQTYNYVKMNLASCEWVKSSDAVI